MQVIGSRLLGILFWLEHYRMWTTGAYGYRAYERMLDKIHHSKHVYPAQKQDHNETTIVTSSDQGTCQEIYKRFYANHTACLVGTQDLTDEGVSDQSKTQIVELHNWYRRQVGNGGKSEGQKNPQPSATNMQKMYWDEELAHIAQKWASNCYFEHDEAAARHIPGSYAVGQNLAKGHLTWYSAISHWHSEVDNLMFGVGNRYATATVGHYTQLVWAESALVGCGYALCNQSQVPFYVCNYAPTGNYPSRMYIPYNAGKKGAACPSTFNDDLCDCGGKVCRNRGTLNLNSCECTCTSLDWIKGENCSMQCSMAQDSLMCKAKGGNLNKDDCKKFEEVSFEYCPVSCGLCTDKDQVTTFPSGAASSDHWLEFDDSTEAVASAVSAPEIEEEEDNAVARLEALLGIGHYSEHAQEQAKSISNHAKSSSTGTELSHDSQYERSIVNHLDSSDGKSDEKSNAVWDELLYDL